MFISWCASFRHFSESILNSMVKNLGSTLKSHVSLPFQLPTGVALDVCILPTSFLSTYSLLWSLDKQNPSCRLFTAIPTHPIFSSSPQIPTSKGFQPPRHLPGAKMLPKPPNQPSSEEWSTNCLLKIGFFPPGIRVKPSKDSNDSLT